MCSRTTCSECNKPTFRGCGMHVEQVLGDVPRDQRCQCREKGSAAKKQQASVLEKLWPFSHEKR